MTVDVKPYNRQYQYTPSAVMYPKTATEVGDIVKCASKHNRKVQARSGGHDYSNKGKLVVYFTLSSKVD